VVVGNKTQETKDPVLNYTIKEPGEYPLSVSVRDDEKASSISSEVTVYAGNEQPQVDIRLEGNRSFYFPGKPVKYQIKVIDNDSLNMKNLFVGSDYVQGNEDLAAEGHQFVPDEIIGKNLTMSLDCKACHKEQEKVIGPAYVQVAQRYRKDPKASSYLMLKIMKGGSGVWGEAAMPAHPNLKGGDVKQMVQYILSLGKHNKK
jgi:cytochrome c551/c552